MFFGLGKISKKSRLNKINKEFATQIGRIATQIAKGKRNEEETRRWCVDLLRSAMGYKDSEIETELSVLGQRVDIALKKGNHVFMVIECKAATMKLNNAAICQAANYAVALGADWAVVTNGHTWMLFHVAPVRGGEPDVVMVFDVSILDDDGLSKADVGYLYLLTKEAVSAGETMMGFHEANCITAERFKKALYCDEAVSAIVRRLESDYRTAMGVPVSIANDQVRSILMELSEACID